LPQAVKQNPSQIRYRTDMTDERRGLPHASPFNRYQLCAGSWALEQDAKRLGQEAHRESEAAACGDRIHAWLASEKVELIESEVTTAQFLKERGDEQVERIFEGREYQTLREKRLWLSIDGKPALSGRFDVVSYTPELALVQDWKCGFSEPDAAEQNAQLKVLAVLVALNLPTVKEVIVQIVSGPYGVTEARYSLAELSAAYEDIVKTLKAINAPDAALSPSSEACKYCPAVLICPAFKKQMLEPVQKQQLAELPIDPEEVSDLLDRTEAVTRYAEQVKKFYAQRLIDDPSYSIPGWGMVPGATRREVTNWHAARKRLEEFIDEKDLAASETYSLVDIEKALGRKLKLKSREAKTKLNEILAGLIEEKQNAASLKRVRGEMKINELINAR
jgi:Protein of unknown function (DUF2800)